MWYSGLSPAGAWACGSKRGRPGPAAIRFAAVKSYRCPVKTGTSTDGAIEHNGPVT
jgi:hypothetical protein